LQIIAYLSPLGLPCTYRLTDACCPSIRVALGFLSRSGNPEYLGFSFPYQFITSVIFRTLFHNWLNIPFPLGISPRSYILGISFLNGRPLFWILPECSLHLRQLSPDFSSCSAFSLPNRPLGPVTSHVTEFFSCSALSLPNRLLWTNDFTCH
jgi:hypothetical protein